jgi:hypothetical protein
MPVRRKNDLIKDYDLNVLLNRFEVGTTVDENQVIHFHHLDHQELERILPDAFEADTGFTPRQVRNLLREALWSCRKNGPITIAGLTAEAQRIAKARLSQPLERYAMWTKFRARQMAFAKGFRLKWDGVSLQSSNDLPRYMIRQPYFLNGHGNVHPERPHFYGYLITRCEARTAEKSVSKMIDATDLFMAIFNMYETWGCWSDGSERYADGKLWHGPYHFVFQGTTFLGDEHLWYDPMFSEKAWDTFSLDIAKVLPLIPRVRDALKALANHPLRKVLIDTLRLMQNAMSSRDQSHSLLRYWSALEQLYGEPHAREKNYSRIIQRASFAEHDRVVARWKLGHISRQRNEYVHAGGGDEDLHAMSQYLRMLLSRHVNYLLFHAPYVRSHAHWLEIVDLPNDEAALEARKTSIDHRLGLIRQGRGGAQDSSA